MVESSPATDSRARLTDLTVPDEIIGLWRFREVGQPRRWAATFCVDGHYYDTLGHRTLTTCLAAVARQLRVLRKSGHR